MVVPDAGIAEHVIDTDRYPLADPTTPEWAVEVARVRRDLAADGCSVLADFIRPDRRDQLRRECAEVAPQAYYEAETVNVYNTVPDPSLPAGHPARTTMRRDNAFVARDQIPAGAVVQQLYTSRLFQRFVAECFGLPVLHELADPLAGLCLNVLTPGRGHPWHFDTNEFTVSMLTQQPEGGGEFEYCPQIRSTTSENVDEVAAVLGGGGRERVRTLSLRPGDLQLFRGRYSLHRVRPVTGRTARHSAIFAYSERPGVIGTPERTRQLFGRLAPVHTEIVPAVRVDQLMD